ncbi:MAG: hypothetical protein KatS3mg109_0048 [Pirellulaceae bacterium]|nr:MAG: hypothetical protein KatS3mg109_0048 [Pirellulaceae bacterium]
MVAQRFIEDNSSGNRLDTDLGGLTSHRVLKFLDRDVTVGDVRMTVVDTSAGAQTVTFDGHVGEIRGYRKSGGNPLFVQRNGTNIFVGGGTSVTVDNIAYFVLQSSGVIEKLSEILDGLPPDSVTNVELANMPANTIKGNPTGSVGSPQDIPVAAGRLIGRGDSGNLAALTPAEARQILRRNKVTLTASNPQNWDLSQGLYFERGGVTSNFTLNFPSNVSEGETAFMVFLDGGGATVTFASGFKMAGGGTSTVLANGETRLEFFFTSATTAQVSQTNFA